MRTGIKIAIVAIYSKMWHYISIGLRTFIFTVVKGVKTNFYSAMNNCDNDPKQLQKSQRNIVEHYEVDFMCGFLSCVTLLTFLI